MHFSRMLILSVTVTCAIWTAAVPARAQTEAELAYGNAKLLFEKGDWAQARDLLVAASQTDDKNPDIVVLLGKAEYQLGNVEKAMEAWRRTLQLAPKHAYARRMIDALSGQAMDVDVRLRIVAGLLRDGLLEPARLQLSRLSRDGTLSDVQRGELLLLDADCLILAGSGNMALDRLRELAVRYPDESKEVRVMLLLGRANLSAGGDLVPKGLAQLRQVVADHAEEPEADAARFELIAHQLTEDPTATEPLVAWIKAHPDHRSAGAARRDDEEGLTTHLVGIAPQRIGHQCHVLRTAWQNQGGSYRCWSGSAIGSPRPADRFRVRGRGIDWYRSRRQSPAVAGRTW